MKYSQEFKFDFFIGKFYWKELMKLNIKHIEKTSDISSLYPYIQNILYTRLNFDNIDVLSDEYIIQLVTLLQLTGQYLVFAQKTLEEENNDLKETNRNLKNIIYDNKNYQRIIDNLTRQNQEKDFLIKTYQDMIQNGNENETKNEFNVDDKNINSKSVHEINYINKTYYYCNICLKKKFKTQKYLDDHMMRRHYNQKQIFINKENLEEEKIEDDNYRMEFEEKINKMRIEFINMINKKEENNELSLLNKKLDLLQTQIVSQNYNNINYKSNINYYNKKNYQKYVSNLENKDKALKLLQLKYDDLNQQYNDLLGKIEEKNKFEIEFSRQITQKEKKEIIKQEKKSKDFKNKIIIIDNDKINIEIKPEIIIKKAFNIEKKEKENENDENKNKDMNQKLDIKNFDNFRNEKKKNEEENQILLKEKNKNEINIELDNNINIINHINKEREKNKFLTNDGNETLVIEQKKLSDSKKEEINHSINDKNSNDSNKQNIIINKELEESKHSRPNINKIKDNIFDRKIKLNNEENKKSDNIDFTEGIDKLKIFYKQIKIRDDNCLKTNINSYEKTELIEEPNIIIKELIKDKKHSEEYIKKYKNYDYLDKELGLKELFDSYNELKKNKNQTQTQTFIKNSSFQNSNIGGPSHILKSSTSNNIMLENPYKSKISKINEVVESSFIKGFDLIKSTK